MTESTYSLPVMETVKTAWAKVGGVKGSCWALLGLFILAMVIVGFLGSLGGKEGVIHFIFSFIGAIIQILAGGSLVYLGIRRAQDMPVSYKMAKDVLNARIILYLIGLYILQILIFIPAGILAGIGAALVHMTSSFVHFFAILCFLASIVLFIYLGVRMWLATGAIVDKNLNSWDAIKLSFKATRGNVWNLIGLYIITFCIVLVCTITIGIGYIWGFPWLLITYGEAYKRLSTRQDIHPLG